MHNINRWVCFNSSECTNSYARTNIFIQWSPYSMVASWVTGICWWYQERWLSNFHHHHHHDLLSLLSLVIIIIIMILCHYCHWLSSSSSRSLVIFLSWLSWLSSSLSTRLIIIIIIVVVIIIIILNYHNQCHYQCLYILTYYCLH